MITFDKMVDFCNFSCQFYCNLKLSHISRHHILAVILVIFSVWVLKMTQVPKLKELDILSISVTLMQEVLCEISQSTSNLLNIFEERLYKKETKEFCDYRQDLHK